MTTPSYFSIFNPSLGATDETLFDQILFYYSPVPATINEKLRRVGLAQGMVEFARPFAKGKPVSYIRTHQAWVIMLEVEKNWWILAVAKNIPHKEIPNSSSKLTTYSDIDVPSPELLQASILRGYRLWRLLNGSFQHGLQLQGKKGFSSLLEEWWTMWISKWKFRLHSLQVEEFWCGTIMSQPTILKEEIKEIHQFIHRLRLNTQSDVYDMIIHRISGRRGCVFTGTGHLRPFEARNLSVWVDGLIDDIMDTSLTLAEPSVYERFKVSGDAMMNVLSFGGYTLLKKTFLEKKVEDVGKETGSFVVGLMSPATKESEAVIVEKTVYLEDDHINRLELENDIADAYSSVFSIIVWKTKEYVFTVLVKPNSKFLQAEEFYSDLGVDLDNLITHFSKASNPGSSEDGYFYLIYDPSNLTVSSTIPSINSSFWPLEDGIHLHTQMLILPYGSSTRTQRGWWIFKTKVEENEIVILRKALVKEKDGLEDFEDEVKSFTAKVLASASEQ